MAVDKLICLFLSFPLQTLLTPAGMMTLIADSPASTQRWRLPGRLQRGRTNCSASGEFLPPLPLSA
ncbi:unnamed protein product [Protopolystoma xenopodis]|uniref:Uncharacterized protein n=1 Tax=Protopolystoma xenopodis TaxID=117903 RepID=A0A3S5BRT5_9PLAT|nr:unnamed protein product [Protopolystoma xenopodis]